MARRKKGHRGSKSHAIPVGEAFVIGYPILQGFKTGGLTIAGAENAMYRLTGYSGTAGKWASPMTGVTNGVILLLMGTVGKKVANRVGANRLLKKISAGYLQLF